MGNQNLKNVLDDLLKILNSRTREVVEKRFGIRSVFCQTLEAIGKNFGITRERVRQIEALGLRQITNKNALETLKPFFELIEKQLKNCDGVKKEDLFLKELAEFFSLKEKNNENLISFALALGGGRFKYFKETLKWYSAWALSDEDYKGAIDAVDALKNNLVGQNSPVPQETIVKMAAFPLAHICLSKEISQNPFGEWGVVDSPEISPRGVKDKAYMIFKKEKKPLHFEQVAGLINKAGFNGRKAHSQTVHNELIKDERFVLVGRGTYALAEWGYEPGTVRDVLVSMLKKSKNGLTKEEIINTVKAKRMVKENTIILNLQNKKLFKKIDNKRFTLL